MRAVRYDGGSLDEWPKQPKNRGDMRFSGPGLVASRCGCDLERGNPLRLYHSIAAYSDEEVVDGIRKSLSQLNIRSRGVARLLRGLLLRGSANTCQRGSPVSFSEVCVRPSRKRVATVSGWTRLRCLPQATCHRPQLPDATKNSDCGGSVILDRTPPAGGADRTQSQQYLCTGHPNYRRVATRLSWTAT